MAITLEHKEKSLLLNVPRTASLGGFLARTEIRERLRLILDVPERFTAIEVRARDGKGEWERFDARFAHASALADCASTLDGVCGIRLEVKGDDDDAMRVDSGSGWDDLERECRQSFFNGVKEATYATHASASKAMTMTRESADAMWAAAQRGDYEGLRRAESSSAELREGRREVLPVRVYEVRDGSFARAVVVSAPASVERRDITVGDALRQFGVDLRDVRTVISQGIEVDLDFDLAKTHEALRHVDGFLYLVTHCRTSS